MPRQNDAGELWKRLSSITLFREVVGGGNQLITAAVLGTGAETTITLAASTLFTVGDPVVSDGDGGMELLVIGTPAASMPVTPPPRVAQSANLARMVEMVAVSLGKIAQDSVSWTGNRDTTAIFEEVNDAPVAYISGSAEFGASFGLYGYNGPNMQTLMGYAESETGTGVGAAAPNQTPMGYAGNTLALRQVLRIQGIRYDAKNVQIDFNNCFFSAKINAPVGRSKASVLNAEIKSSSVMIRVWT